MVGKYITGVNIQDCCEFSYDELRYNTKQLVACNGVIKNSYYVKTDYLPVFFDKYTPDSEFILFTGKSDYPINVFYERFLKIPQLKKWYGINIDMEHPKLQGIPIGLSDTVHIGLLESKMTLCKNKTEILYHPHYNRRNNKLVRTECFENTGAPMDIRRPFGDYMCQLGKHKFVVSPEGNGIDCHRTWEALMMGCIPIVTRSHHMNFFKDFPIIIIETWNELPNLYLDALYDTIWNNFNVAELYLENYLRRLELI